MSFGDLRLRLRVQKTEERRGERERKRETDRERESREWREGGKWSRDNESILFCSESKKRITNISWLLRVMP